MSEQNWIFLVIKKIKVTIKTSLKSSANSKVIFLKNKFIYFILSFQIRAQIFF